PTNPPAAAADSGRGGQRGQATGAGGAGGGPAGNPNRAPADPAQSDPDLSVRWFDVNANTRQREFLTHRFPGMKDAPILATHACHYESTSSRNFIIDIHPAMSNVWIAGCGNAEAYKSGPVIGQYIARRVMGIHGDPEIAKQFVIP